MTLRWEGVRFTDGSCAVRRIAEDPCDRCTLNFETLAELDNDIGLADVTWLWRAPTPLPSEPNETYTRFGQERARSLGLSHVIRGVDDFSVPFSGEHLAYMSTPTADLVKAVKR